MIHDSMQVPSARLVSFLLSRLDPIAMVFCSIAGSSCRIGVAAVLAHAVCRLASPVLPVLLSADPAFCTTTPAMPSLVPMK
jgi:hypothetical protein